MICLKKIFIGFLIITALPVVRPNITLASDTPSEKAAITEIRPEILSLQEESIYETEDESWFSRYKWWLLLGVIIISGAAAAAAGGGGGSGDSDAPVVH